MGFIDFLFIELKKVETDLFSSKSELLLGILDLLFSPGGVGDVLLDLELGCRVHSLPSSV